MATTHDPRPQTSPTAARGWPRRLRWTKEEYHRLAQLGFFQDRKVELFAGELYELVTHPPHDTSVGLVADALLVAFGPGFVIRSQMTLDLGRRYQPEPDILVCIGDRRDFASAHPTTGVLLVEVCDSTIRYDRSVKAHRYALAGIPEYWIVNLVDRQLEVHRRPGPDPDRKGRARYEEIRVVPADGRVEPLARPGVEVAVADLLP